MANAHPHEGLELGKDNSSIRIARPDELKSVIIKAIQPEKIGNKQFDRLQRAISGPWSPAIPFTSQNQYRKVNVKLTEILLSNDRAFTNQQSDQEQKSCDTHAQKECLTH